MGYAEKIYNDYQKQLRNKSNLKCTYPGCDSNCINSHIISRNKLEQISDNNHIFWFQTNKIKGIKEVFTYPVFCSNHDNTVFRDIDGDYVIGNMRQNFLFFYRTYLGAYCRAKRKQNFVKKNKKLSDGNSILMTGDSRYYHAYCEELLNDTKIKFLTYNLPKKEYGIIESCVVIFNKAYPLCVGDFFDLDFDFNGRYLGERNGLSLVVFPQDEQTIAIISWNETDSESYRFISELFDSSDEETKRIVLSMLIVNCCQNIALSPIYWENNFSYQEKQVLKQLSSEKSYIDDTEIISLFKD